MWFARPAPIRCFFFFFNDTATTEIYTLSLHDALPIYGADRGGEREHPGERLARRAEQLAAEVAGELAGDRPGAADRKSTRLNSSHSQISYAVFCLKKKKNETTYGIEHASTPPMKQP